MQTKYVENESEKLTKNIERLKAVKLLYGYVKTEWRKFDGKTINARMEKVLSGWGYSVNYSKAEKAGATWYDFSIWGNGLHYSNHVSFSFSAIGGKFDFAEFEKKFDANWLGRLDADIETLTDILANIAEYVNCHNAALENYKKVVASMPAKLNW